MSRICFGQNFEDVVLWRAFAGLTAGRYLDIGAQHPAIDSVSRSFYLAGWRGIHVEPVPFYANALREDRPDEIVVEAAVGNGTAPLTIHVIEGTGLSTGVPEVAAAHSAAGHSPVAIEVPQITLGALLDRFVGEELNWLKIDVEGMEAAVLASWGESKVRPWVVVIEAIDPTIGSASDGQWRELIEARGYHEVLFDGVSRFFVADEHSELDARLGLPANCLDDFAVPWHHWAAANAVDLFRTEVAAAKTATENLQAENSQVNADLANAIAERQQIEHERSVLSEQLEDLRSERTILSQALDQLDEELAARRTESARLGQELAANVAERGQLEAQLNDAWRQARTVQGQLAGTREQLSRSEQLRAVLDARIDELTEGLDERGAALARTQTELAALRERHAELEQDLARQSERLRVADRIAALSTAATDRWHTFAFAAFSQKGRQVRRDLRNALRSWANFPSDPAAPVRARIEDENETMDLFSYERRNPLQRANSLEDLCRFADRDFIHCAFVTLLGRQADPEGEAYYLARLRGGEAMHSILWSLRRSAEGRAHDPGITGLDRALRKHRNANRPLIGWLVRLFTSREGNSQVERKLRALDNMLSVERNLATSRAATANHLQVTIVNKIDHVEKQLKVALAGQTTTPRQIAQAEAAGDTEWEATLASVLSGR